MASPLGGAIPAARRAARPAGLIRSLVQGTSKVATTVTGRPNAASRSAIDALMSSSAGQPTKVGRISTRIEPSAGCDLDPMDDPEIDDRQHRELRVRDVGEGRADGRLIERAARHDGPRADPRDADLGAGFAHQVAPGSERRTIVNSPHSQRNASP